VTRKIRDKHLNALTSMEKNHIRAQFRRDSRAEVGRLVHALGTMAGTGLVLNGVFCNHALKDSEASRKPMFTMRLAAIAFAALLAGPAVADDPAPFPEFSFKRVTPPDPGAGKRITVQITEPSFMLRPPRAAGRPDADEEAPVSDPGDGIGALAWFWDAVSPSLLNASPGRLEDAVVALSRAPVGRGAPQPRLETLRAIADRHAIEILSSTVGTRVSPALVLAVISVESAGRGGAVSHAGAQGLMQLMPATAARFGVSDSFQAKENIRGGVAYLDFLLQEFGYDPLLAIAAYNAGEGAVREHAGVPPFAETRDYVPKVLAAWLIAKGLCQTPPELITDGCVFVRGRGG